MRYEMPLARSNSKGRALHRDIDQSWIPKRATARPSKKAVANWAERGQTAETVGNHCFDGQRTDNNAGTGGEGAEAGTGGGLASVGGAASIADLPENRPRIFRRLLYVTSLE